jgi:hypothetical protein
MTLHFRREGRPGNDRAEAEAPAPVAPERVPAVFARAREPAERPPGTAEGARDRVGDLNGVWECIDLRVKAVVRVLEFHRDGTYKDTDTVQPRDGGTGRYRPGPGALVLLDPVNLPPQYPADMSIREVGRVTWVNGDLIRYEIVRGTMVGPYARYRAGDVQEFHRAGGTANANPGRAGNLAGAWEQIDPENQQRVAVYEFHRDGTYRLRGDLVRFLEPHDFYRLEGGLLSLVFVHLGMDETLRLRGKMTWVNEDEFTLTVIGGPPGADGQGKRYVFKRKVDPPGAGDNR